MKHVAFCHLHVHTSYSFLDGACRVSHLVAEAARLGFPALAITDHGGMFGAIEFYLKAQKAGVKPIIGSEFYVAPGSRFDTAAEAEGASPYHLVLLAKDLAGYRNLLALSSASYDPKAFYRKPRIDRELLAAHRGGLVALSACLKGEPARRLMLGDEKGAREAAAWYRDLFGEDYFLELQVNGLAEQETVNSGLVRLGRELTIPLVATNDVHYLKREDHRLHDVLLCIQTGKTIHDENRMRMTAEELYLKSAEEMEVAFRDFPGAVANTMTVAERCNLEIPLGKFMLPDFPLPAGVTAEEFLRDKAREGFALRLAHVLARTPEAGRAKATEEYTARLEHELSIIGRMGFPGYFLIVADFIAWARGREIPVGPGRGSAVGSLVSWSLGITDFDPIRYGLLFERFLNPERISMPDIDVDFCQDRRDEVIDYVTAKYGKDRVAQIITFGTLAARAAIRDVGRALDIPYGEVDKIAKLVPEDLYLKNKDATLKDAIDQESRLREAAKKDARIADLLDLAGKAEGLNRHTSVHAAGIVISKDPLIEHVPLYLGKKDETITQYPMEIIEKVGLVKFDFLGLRTLTLIDDAVKRINLLRAPEREKAGGAEPPLDIAAVNLCDGKTFELLARGETDGVFQLESSGMKDLLRRMRSNTFEDLIALVALYRPGPLGSGMVAEFVNRKHGRALVTYELPQLELILRETYGIVVYQEQVMQIAVELAGYSMGEADGLRKAMSKKKQEEMEKQRGRFLDGCRAKGVPEAKARSVFAKMEEFGAYGFNKSHSAAYAFIAFQTAWLKAHYPAQFMAALLSSEMDKTDKVTLHLGVCRDMGIRVLSPDLNESEINFTVVPGGIRFGLAAVKNVGETAVRHILEKRGEGGGKGKPFLSLADFCARVDTRTVNRRVIESLIKAGAFDGCCGGRRSALMAGLDRAMDKGQKAQRDLASGQGGLFGGPGGGAALPDDPLPQVEEWSDHAKLAFEKESLGFYITGHPIERYQREIERYVTSRLGRLGELGEGAVVRVAGIVAGIKPKTTKGGDRMAFVTLEDLDGGVEVVVFPKTFKEAEARLALEQVLVIDGTIDASGGPGEDDGGEKKPKVRAEKIETLADYRRRATRSVLLHLSAVGLSRDDFASLREVLSRHRGTSRVRLKLTFPSRSEAYVRAGDDISVDSSEEMISEVEKLLGSGSVTFE